MRRSPSYTFNCSAHRQIVSCIRLCRYVAYRRLRSRSGAQGNEFGVSSLYRRHELICASRAVKSGVVVRSGLSCHHRESFTIRLAPHDRAKSAACGSGGHLVELQIAIFRFEMNATECERPGSRTHLAAIHADVDQSRVATEQAAYGAVASRWRKGPDWRDDRNLSTI